jgi:uncharacterized protein
VSARTARFPDLRTSVVRTCPAGHPLVLRCAPLRIVGGRPLPFPTLYWLACDEVARQLSQLERTGAIERIQSLLREDVALRDAIASDHRAYAAEREALLEPEERLLLSEHALLEPLRARGIGGIEDPATVKCLHLHYAHHLARGSTIGRLIEQITPIRLCAAAPEGS